MPQRAFSDRTFHVLEKYKVSLAEYFVLCTVGYRIFSPPERLAQDSFNLSEGDPRGEVALPGHLNAIHSCVEKAWLEILTPEEVEREMARRQSAAIPEIADHLKPNTVDFTQEGYCLYRQFIFEIFGAEHVQKSDSGWNRDEVNQTVNMYAETHDLCGVLIKEFKDEPSSYIGRVVEIIDVSEIETIGPWRPNRFITLPHGFHARVRHRTVET